MCKEKFEDGSGVFPGTRLEGPTKVIFVKLTFNSKDQRLCLSIYKFGVKGLKMRLSGRVGFLKWPLVKGK
jgi:hypothetical protein